MRSCRSSRDFHADYKPFGSFTRTMANLESRLRTSNAGLQPPGEPRSSPIRRSLEEIFTHSRSSIYEDAGPGGADTLAADDDVDDWGDDGSRSPSGLPPHSMEHERLSPGSSLPARLSASSAEHMRAREWWFNAKEAMRGELQHLGHLEAVEARGGHGLTHSVIRDGAGHETTAALSGAEKEAAPGPANPIGDASAFKAVSTGYHAHLFEIAHRFPEAILLVHYALRALGGRWTLERRMCVRDELFVVHLLSRGKRRREHVDCTDEKQFMAFRQMVATPKAKDNDTFSIVILPDVSPLVVEVLGGLLHIDHRVFTNHLWSQHRKPFHVNNRHMYSTQADTEEPEGTTMATVDTEALMYMTGGSGLRSDERKDAKLRWLRSFRHGTAFFPLLDRAFVMWPEDLSPPSDARFSLSAAFHGATRATVHYIQDERAPIQGTCSPP